MGSYQALGDTKNPALFRDAKLMRQLARANPLTLDVLARQSVPTCLEQLIAAEPEPEQLVMLAGHGHPTAMTLSSGFGEERTLDVGDAPKLSGMARAVAVGGSVVLKSCDTGDARDAAPNVANMLAGVFPHANVYAP